MTHVELTPNKTYKTAANAHAAVAKKINPACEVKELGELRYMVMQHSDGRFFPVFIGMNALHYGIHFHFNVIA